MHGREIMNANTPQMLTSRASRDGVGQYMSDRLNIVIHKTYEAIRLLRTLRTVRLLRTLRTVRSMRSMGLARRQGRSAQL